MDITEEKASLLEIEKMIEELQNNIKEQGYDHISMELLHPEVQINADELKTSHQEDLNEELAARIQVFSIDPKLTKETLKPKSSSTIVVFIIFWPLSNFFSNKIFGFF